MFPRNKNGNPWALVKLSIEFCRRERAAVIGAEEYLTEADGARSPWGVRRRASP
jgi:hypothetical protein